VGNGAPGLNPDRFRTEAPLVRRQEEESENKLQHPRWSPQQIHAFRAVCSPARYCRNSSLACLRSCSRDGRAGRCGAESDMTDLLSDGPRPRVGQKEDQSGIAENQIIRRRERQAIRRALWPLLRSRRPGGAQFRLQAY